jgi:hypothetical protein
MLLEWSMDEGASVIMLALTAQLSQVIRAILRARLNFRAFPPKPEICNYSKFSSHLPVKRNEQRPVLVTSLSKDV